MAIRHRKRLLTLDHLINGFCFFKPLRMGHCGRSPRMKRIYKGRNRKMSFCCSGIQRTGNRATSDDIRRADCGCKVRGVIRSIWNRIRVRRLPKICALIRILEEARLLVACFMLGIPASMNYRTLVVLCEQGPREVLYGAMIGQELRNGEARDPNSSLIVQ